MSRRTGILSNEYIKKNCDWQHINFKDIKQVTVYPAFTDPYIEYTQLQHGLVNEAINLSSLSSYDIQPRKVLEILSGLRSRTKRAPKQIILNKDVTKSVTRMDNNEQLPHVPGTYTPASQSASPPPPVPSTSTGIDPNDITTVMDLYRNLINAYPDYSDDIQLFDPTLITSSLKEYLITKGTYNENDFISYYKQTLDGKIMKGIKDLYMQVLDDSGGSYDEDDFMVFYRQQMADRAKRKAVSGRKRN